MAGSERDSIEPGDGAGAVAIGGGGRSPLRLSSPTLATTVIPVDDSAERQVSESLLHFWNILVKWRWLIAAVTALGLAAGTAATLLTTPIYRAVATIQIDMEPAKVQPVQNQPFEGMDDPEKYYLTQYELLKSRTLAERVVQSENLAYDDAFLGRGRAGPRAERDSADRSARMAGATGQVMGGLHIDPVRASRLVKVSFDSPDPATAARIANAVAASFISWNLERRYDASAAARNFLQQRLDQTRQALEASQRRGEDYAQQNRLITIGGGDPNTTDPTKGASTGESIVAADLQQVDANLSTATAARIQAQQHWQQAEAEPDLAVPEVLADPSILNVRQQRAAAQADYEQNLKLYKPNFPSMVEAKAKIDAMDRQVAAMAAAVRKSLKSQYDVARGNEAALQAEVDRRKSELLSSQAKRVEQGFIDTDISTSRTLYDSMLASFKEIGISGAIQDNNISFVDKALTPGGPIKPEPSRNLTLFGAAGLALGAIMAFLLEQFDLSIKVPEEVEKEFRVPVLATIPVLRSNISAAKALANPKSQLSEGYYSARAALQLSTAEGVPSSILITSSMMGEGKSTSALALAAGFGRLGLRVLLIDADMRSPSQHRLLSRDNSVGLSNLLSGGVGVSPALQPTGYDNLTLLAAGPPPPNPPELLAGPKLEALLEGMRSHFDLVVLDAPPVMGLADAPQLATFVEGVLMVVEAGATKRAITRAALRRLRAVHGHILGVLFTKFDIKKAGYAYGYAYSYGYGRGYGFDYGVKETPLPLGLARFGRLFRATR